MRTIDGSHGAWLHFWRARVECVLSVVVYKIQARKRYIESLPLVPKDKSWFSECERSAVQLPLGCVFALWKRDA